MSSTLLERTRASHEELERLQRTLITDLKTTPKTNTVLIILKHKGGVNQSHRVVHLLDRIVETSTTLEKIYIDADGSRKDGIASIAGSGPSLYSLFYDRLREIREYHRKYPNLEVERPENLHIPPPNIAFSGAEKYGKYLDLNEPFERYNNLGDGYEKKDYLTFLTTFQMFDKIPEARLYNKQYKYFIDGLHAYLVSYFERTQPLLNLDKELESVVKAFEAKWASGELQNGNSSNNNNNTTTTQPAAPTPTPAKPTPPPAPATASASSSEKSSDDKKKKNKKQHKRKKDKSAEPEPTTASEPMEVDTPKKVSDFDNPLYCRACAKIFSKDTVFKGHLSGKKHIQAEQDVLKLRRVLQEVRVGKMAEMLEDTVNATHTNVQHWQSLIGTERWAEQMREEQEDEEPEEEEDDLDYDDDDDEPIRMTIKDYPIGWDGKPIPYWLYKLHGLGVEYKCEICGNTSYFGRKNFERHFQESRHAHGMACLNIPNSKHFQEITKIADAVALWQKIKEDNKKMEWRPDTEEECEDADGHVMAKKTYEDLRRQGLLD